MHDAADEALLAATVAGDPEAAAAFVRRFQHRVYGVARSVVGNADQADEVAQEAFLRAWRNGESYDPRRGSVSTWLLAITRNLAIDGLRARRSRPSDPVDPIDLRIAAVDLDPALSAVADDERRRVLQALRSIPAEQRRAVVLAALAGRTAQEVGEIEGIPLGTAKTRIRLGLIRLRGLLADPAPMEVER